MKPWQLLLFAWMAFSTRNQRLVIGYLQTENAILREKLGRRRLLLNNSQRIRLAEKAKQIGRAGLSAFTTIFSPDTLLRWHRELCARHHTCIHENRKGGRPALSMDHQQLIIRLAKENRLWGYDRIVGECSNLGIKVSATSVANILREQGLEPAPKRGKSTTWAEFIGAHREVLAAVDFTTMDVWTLKGLRTYYLLFFMEIGSRKIHFAGLTTNPDEVWMLHIANQIQQGLVPILRNKRMMLMDRDTKFSLKFRQALQDTGIEPIRLPPRSPNCNAFIERFMRSIKSECLRRMIFFGEAMLSNAVEKYLDYYHTHRNHQGLYNQRIDPPPEESDAGKIYCEHELGGILKHYHRRAA